MALAGVREEAAGGQRTTVDVLNAQQDLISARARLIGAQRDRVIASYTPAQRDRTARRQDARTSKTPDYLPEVHYHQVRDAWHGLRTPSGTIRPRGTTRASASNLPLPARAHPPITSLPAGAHNARARTMRITDEHAGRRPMLTRRGMMLASIAAGVSMNSSNAISGQRSRRRR